MGHGIISCNPANGAGYPINACQPHHSPARCFLYDLYFVEEETL